MLRFRSVRRQIERLSHTMPHLLDRRDPCNLASQLYQRDVISNSYSEEIDLEIETFLDDGVLLYLALASKRLDPTKCLTCHELSAPHMLLHEITDQRSHCVGIELVAT